MDAPGMFRATPFHSSVPSEEKIGITCVNPYRVNMEIHNWKSIKAHLLIDIGDDLLVGTVPTISRS